MDSDSQSHHKFDLRRALNWLGLIVLTLTLMALVWYGGKVLLLVFAGVLVAVVLRAPIGFLVRRTGMHDKVAYGLVLLLLVALLVGFGFLIGPQVLNQAGEFSERVPTIVNNARDYLESRTWGRWIVDQLGMSSGPEGTTGTGAAQDAAAGTTANGPTAGAEPATQTGTTDTTGGADDATPTEGAGQDGTAQAGAGQAGAAEGGAARSSSDGGGAAVADVASRVTGITSTILTTLAHIALVIVLGLFLAVNPALYRRGIVRLFPADAQQRAAEVVDELGRTLKYWLIGQLALMFITALLTGIGLVVLGIPLALALAFFVFLTEFIPFVGPIIGFIPIVMMAATQGSSTVLWALILYVVIQQIEGNILTPLIQQRAVSLPPALTVSAVFLAGALFGPVGVILATPLIAVAYVLVKMLYVHDTLGQRVEVPGKTEPA